MISLASEDTDIPVSNDLASKVRASEDSYCNFRMSMEGFLSHRLCTDDDVLIASCLLLSLTEIQQVNSNDMRGVITRRSRPFSKTTSHVLTLMWKTYRI